MLEQPKAQSFPRLRLIHNNNLDTLPLILRAKCCARLGKRIQGCDEWLNIDLLTRNKVDGFGETPRGISDSAFAKSLANTYTHCHNDLAYL